MGLFDRFRPAAAAHSAASASNQHATRLIESGQDQQAQGQLDLALAAFREAAAIAPNPARAHLNQGNVLLLMGNLDAALAAFRTAIRHQPDYAGAYYNIGNALLNEGKLDDAVANFHQALEIQPDYAEVHCSLGVALKELGRLDDAIASLQHALQLNPDLAEAQINLGNMLESLYNTGHMLLTQGKPEQAATHFRRALLIEPDHAEAHVGMGVILHNQGLFEPAIAHYRRALETKPDYAEAYFDLGNALKDMGQLDKAVAHYQQALNIQPRLVEAHNNLGLAMQQFGQLEEAIASYHRALELLPGFIDTIDNLLLALNYTAAHPPSHYLEQARQFGRVAAARVAERFTAWQCDAHPQRLRVGLVSGDLCAHSVGHFLEGLLAHIDPARIELVAYPTHHLQDDLTARIRPRFSAWKPLFGLDDEAAARLIHADGIHILIDLSGHTAHNRLPVFAWKPAPVQFTWLGLPATTGLAEIDYVLGDPHAIPAEYESHFSEAVWRMPDSCLCLTVPASPVNVAPFPAPSTGYMTFGSFNNLTKMNDAVVAVWARILKAVPNSRLLLKTRQLGEPSICTRTLQRFAACGIAPEQLILSRTFPSRDEHLAAYNKVDIALDTFPYPGVTTSVEALWMGVPVLSMLGDRFISRTAGSIAHNAGLADWVAADEDDYVARAVAFASDLEQLAVLRAGLRQRVLASPLFDAPRFARNFEDALWGMWQRYRQRSGSPGR